MSRQEPGRALPRRRLPPRPNPRVSSTVSSRRWRPVRATKTSSRLTCRVVSRASGRFRRSSSSSSAGMARWGSPTVSEYPSVSLRAERTESRPAKACGSGGSPLRLEAELDDVVAPEPGDQLAGRAQRDHLAVVDDRHPVAEPFGLVHVVGREEDGPAARAEAARSRPRAGAATGGRGPSSARRGRAARGRRPARWRRRAAAAGRRRAAR